MARLLVADDDLEALELLKTVLEVGGHQVTTATDGKDALEKGLSGDFAIYILDVTMPFLDGYHVAQAISEKFPARKIMLLTSRDYVKDKLAVESCGADAHMSKPYDINELLRVINDMVQSPK